MAISRQKKEELVQKYVEQLNGSDAIIITGYRGLTVTQLQELRTKIREAEGAFAVVKNTLAERALSERENLDEQIVLAFRAAAGVRPHPNVLESLFFLRL